MGSYPLYVQVRSEPNSRQGPFLKKGDAKGDKKTEESAAVPSSSESGGV